ncbi:4-hydroxy-tetrahydrodipicolinate synthase [Rhodohalobacter sp. SW132]|nr:4-hydroxy-tetrahydrodipicolinate synthase [Rhodohalobacter sp. SW132]
MTDLKQWTALITPMENDGSIHFESLRRMVERQEAAENGILLIGSTGEGLALSDSEKKEVVDFVSGINPDVPLMVGVGGMNLSVQTEWVEYCNTLNIDAFLMVTPLYSKPGPEGQYQWFKALLDRSEKPCMLYNIPSRTGIDLPFVVAEKLAEHRNMWSIKEASGSLAVFREFRERVPGIPLYSGDDALVSIFRPYGCSGSVSVASNAWPEATKLYTNLCLSGKTESLFPLWNRAVKALFSASNPIPVKKLLHSRGEISSATLRLPLTEDELTDLTELETIDNEINNWYKENYEQ